MAPPDAPPCASPSSLRRRRLRIVAARWSALHSLAVSENLRAEPKVGQVEGGATKGVTWNVEAAPFMPASVPPSVADEPASATQVSWCSVGSYSVDDYLCYLWADRQAWIDFAADMTIAYFNNVEAPAPARVEALPVQAAPHQKQTTGDEVDALAPGCVGQGGHNGLPISEEPEPAAPASVNTQFYRTLTSQSVLGTVLRERELTHWMNKFSYSGELGEVKTLLAFGASVNRPDGTFLRTPFEEAMRSGKQLMADFLVSRGAVAESSQVLQKREEERAEEQAQFLKMDAHTRARFHRAERLHYNTEPLFYKRRALSP